LLRGRFGMRGDGKVADFQSETAAIQAGFDND
jgi:hypothetical protein